jgi:hypothetical protein
MSESQPTIQNSLSSAPPIQNTLTYTYPAYYSPYAYPTNYGTYAIDPFTYSAYTTTYTPSYQPPTIPTPLVTNSLTSVIATPTTVINTSGTKRRIEEHSQEPITSGSKKPRLINVQNANAQTSPGNPNTIFLGNLPNDVTEQTIIDIFSKCGRIKEVRLKKQPDTGKVMG